MNTPVISQLSCPHWSMRGTFDCGVDFPGCQLRACGGWRRPPAHLSSDPTDMRGESTPQPNVRRMLQCKQLNCEVTGVSTKARTSRAQLKPQQYLEFGQKVSRLQR